MEFALREIQTLLWGYTSRVRVDGQAGGLQGGYKDELGGHGN